MHGDLQKQLNPGACWTGTASSEPDSPLLTKQAAGRSAGECTANACVCALEIENQWLHQKPQFKQCSPFYVHIGNAQQGSIIWIYKPSDIFIFFTILSRQTYF